MSEPEDKFISETLLILKEVEKFVENRIHQSKIYCRIISDEEIPFPKNYEWVKHDPNIEISNLKWNETHGWGKPDIIIEGLEIFYLWKKLIIY